MARRKALNAIRHHCLDCLSVSCCEQCQGEAVEVMKQRCKDQTVELDDSNYVNMGLTFSWPFLMEKVYHHFAEGRETSKGKMLVAYLDMLREFRAMAPREMGELSRSAALKEGKESNWGPRIKSLRFWRGLMRKAYVR